MNATIVLRAAGVVLLTIMEVHFMGMPWGLVVGAGLALALIP